MSDTDIVFQHASHFLSRASLRLEFLFRIINEACSESHEIIHRFALKSIIEVIEIIEKPELKSRFLKELIRIEHVLKRTITTPESQILDKVANQIHELNQLPGRFDNKIHDDVFLNVLRQIHQPNTKDCEYIAPQLVLWLELCPKKRQNTIRKWLGALKAIEQTVTLYLSLLRDTAHFIPITAHNGFYQHGLSPQAINHLILLKIDKTLGITPKIQLGHHNLTLRLYELATAQEIKNQSINMEIGFCQI